MGHALIDVWFSLWGLSDSVIYIYGVLNNLFSCIVDFHCLYSSRSLWVCLWYKK